MSDSKYRLSEFHLVGQLLGFIIKDGYKIKYLRLASNQQEYWIKPSKEICSSINFSMIPGTWLEISGTRKLCLKTGIIKLKADTVTVKVESPETQSQLTLTPQTCGKAKILVCQKSSCWKRGGKEICQALDRYIKENSLENQVEIKPTGCLKQCKNAPNVVIMPDKKRYSQVQRQDIPILLEKHLNESKIGLHASQKS